MKKVVVLFATLGLLASCGNTKVTPTANTTLNSQIVIEECLFSTSSIAKSDDKGDSQVQQEISVILENLQVILANPKQVKAKDMSATLGEIHFILSNPQLDDRKDVSAILKDIWVVFGTKDKAKSGLTEQSRDTFITLGDTYIVLDNEQVDLLEKIRDLLKDPTLADKLQPLPTPPHPNPKCPDMSI